MNGMILKSVVGMLVAGLALWGPGVPLVLAQVDFSSPEIIGGCERIATENPELAPVVREVLESCQADPNVAREVETTIEVDRQATETTKTALANPEAVVQETVSKLTANGVPPEVAQATETQLREALKGARDTLARGGSLTDAEKYFSNCKEALKGCEGYVKGDWEKVFAGGGRSGAGIDFVGRLADSPDVYKACLETHFREAAATMRAGIEAGTPPAELMRQMETCGVKPGDLFHGEHGEFAGPSKEAIAKMTPDQRAGYEAWKTQDFATVNEMAKQDSMRAIEQMGGATFHDSAGNVVSRETMFREMAEVTSRMRETQTLYNEKDMLERYKPSSDVPRTESSGMAEVWHGCSGLTAAEKATHRAHGHCNPTD